MKLTSVLSQLLHLLSLFVRERDQVTEEGSQPLSLVGSNSSLCSSRSDNQDVFWRLQFHQAPVSCSLDHIALFSPAVHIHVHFGQRSFVTKCPKVSSPGPSFLMSQSAKSIADSILCFRQRMWEWIKQSSSLFINILSAPFPPGREMCITPILIRAGGKAGVAGALKSCYRAVLSVAP